MARKEWGENFCLRQKRYSISGIDLPRTLEYGDSIQAGNSGRFINVQFFSNTDVGINILDRY